ncbi:GGDEF domain-containing protein [Thiobacillus sp.]|uniref:GGDEF domain-containing protein n=1 Tax=Thiobacillus sp. TaxID=924 RepID=UPI0025EB9302|nr:GGDEF domain-containing protein [Thiobacillus sp.]
MTEIPPHGLFRRWPLMGVAPDDSEDLRLKKAVMTITSTSIAFLAIFWGSFYIYNGYPFSGAIPLTYSVVSFSSTLHFFKTRHFAFFCFSQQLLILLLPYFLMWSLGGFANGSVVMIWAIFAPLAALFFIDLKAATRWMLAFLALLILSALFDQTFAAHARPMPAGLNTFYFLLNLGCGFILIAIMLYYFVKDRESAYTKLQQSETHIRELMLTDPLTDVANRRHLDSRMVMELSRQMRYGPPLSVILTDIDWFKRVNDTYGHAVGDTVLKAFADHLRDSLRVSDFVARYGGEEFVLLLPNTTIEDATALAERIRETTKQILFEQPELCMTASFGVTAARPGETMTEVLSRADEAMYQSKSHGRDQVSVLME